MPRHTAGGIIVGPDGRIIVVHQNKNSWSFPKGGIEEDETPRQAAVREIWEETGLKDIAFVGDLGMYERYSLNSDGTGDDTSRPKSQKTMFLYTTLEEKLTSQDPVGETEPRWVTIDEALSLLTHEKDREFLRSVRARIEML